MKVTCSGCVPARGKSHHRRNQPRRHAVPALNRRLARRAGIPAHPMHRPHRVRQRIETLPHHARIERRRQRALRDRVADRQGLKQRLERLEIKQPTGIACARRDRPRRHRFRQQHRRERRDLRAVTVRCNQRPLPLDERTARLTLHAHQHRRPAVAHPPAQSLQRQQHRRDAAPATSPTTTAPASSAATARSSAPPTSVPARNTTAGRPGSDSGSRS